MPLIEGESVAEQGSGLGFAPNTHWGWRDAAAGQALYTSGLNYSDAQGAELVTTGGAVRFQHVDTENVWHRDILDVEQRPEEYWISFLLRWDSPPGGLVPSQTLFWSPDGVWDRAAVGIDAATPGEIGFIHGQSSSIVLNSNKTHWIVARIARNLADSHANLTTDSAQLWVDSDLTELGHPQAEYHGTTYLDSIRTRNGWNVKMEPISTGAFSLDEFRWGNTFRDVAPQRAALTCDLNTDRTVDAADASILFGNWAQSGGVGDCNFDEIVDAADAGILFAAWTGDAASSQYVPESGNPHVWLTYFLFSSCKGAGATRGSGKSSTGRTSRI